MAKKPYALHVDIKSSPDSLFTRHIFDDTYSRLDATLHDEANPDTRTIGDGEEEALPMGGVATGALLYVRASRQVTVKITSSAGSAQAILVGPSAAVGGILLLEGSFTAVSIANDSGGDAEILAFVGGAS